MAAADKFAFSRFSEQRSYKSSDTAGYDEYVEGVEPEETMSLHTPIGKDNIGFRLITKMGWTSGTGLGKNEQAAEHPRASRADLTRSAGRKDPVPFELKDDNMGLGRWQMELEQAQDATEKRRQLEIEKEVTPDLIEKYKAHVEKEQRIASATADLRATYYCEPCDKQYRTYSEFDNHLNSYDHHHRQRLKDLYQQELSRKFGGQKNVQEEKEKKMAAKQVAVEREKMLARRARVGANPGFKPIGQEPAATSGSNPSSKVTLVGVAMGEGKGEEEAVRTAEKKARLVKYGGGLKFESAGVLNSVSEKATPKAPSKTRPVQSFDMFSEVDVGMATGVRPTFGPQHQDHVSGDGDGEDGEEWEESDHAHTTTFRPSFSLQPTHATLGGGGHTHIAVGGAGHAHTVGGGAGHAHAGSLGKVLQLGTPHLLSTLSHSTPPAPPKMQPALPTPSNAHQAAGPPPLLRKGHHMTQTFNTEQSDDEEDEGLIRARVPAGKEQKIKFSIKK